jgi:hyaluronoglucosaminidase
MKMEVELGLIEGFYGRPWTWEERVGTIEALAPHGYRFYIYAPKADPYLRKRWQELHPESDIGQLQRLARRCADIGVRFGVGLSPYDLHADFGATAREALLRKIEELNSIGIDDLGILFDDMRGDLPELARQQARIVDWIASHADATRIIVCPSYYTDDPVLDRVFGRRPDDYLRELGDLLDPALQIFWTGEEVCSREISAGHLDRVAEEIGRKPFLWDNYPVNDGQRMSQYLHLRAFTGRRPEIATRISAHGVNPASQAYLTRIPALTLPESYRAGVDYAYGAAFHRAAVSVLGEPLATMLRDDLLVLQDVGLDRLGEKEAALRERYAPVDHPAAREIIAWLDGEYRITDEIVRTQ